MALPIPEPIATNPPLEAVAPLDAVAPLVLDAQPTRPEEVAGVNINAEALSLYRVRKGDQRNTNLTVPTGVTTYENLGIVLVTLPAGRADMQLYIAGQYRTVKNGDKIIVSLQDQVRLLRRDSIVSEIPDANLTVAVA